MNYDIFYYTVITYIRFNNILIISKSNKEESKIFGNINTFRTSFMEN